MKTRQWKNLKMIITTMCLSMLFACGGAEDNSPEAVAVNLVKAGLNNDIKTIKSLYHSDIISAIEKKSGTKFEEAVKMEEKNTDNEKSYKISMIDCSKKNGLIIVLVKQENLNPDVPKRLKDTYYAISLADDNGKWRVVEVKK